MATGVSGLRCCNKIRCASTICPVRRPLLGLYKASTKSLRAAASNRREITGQGVSRSDKEIEQKSWVSGAPTKEAQADNAVLPGTTSTSISLSGVQPDFSNTS